MAKRKSQSRLSEQWIPTSQAAKVLGITPKKLLGLVSDLRRGEHWINVTRSDAKRACYRWNLSNLLAYFSKV